MAEDTTGGDAGRNSFAGGLAAARAYAEALERIEDAQGAVEGSGRRLGSTLTTALTQATARGRDLGDALRAAALSFSSRSLNAALRPVGDAVGKAVSGVVGDLVGGVVPFAKGGVVGGPTLFPLGGGQVGLMGERGAEAILPLARGPDGRLGVAAGGGGAPIAIHIHTPDVEGFRRSESQIAALVGRAVARGGRNL